MSKHVSKFKLNDNNFQIIDKAKRKNNGIYNYEDLIEIEIKKSTTNRLISFLSVIFDLFTGSATGGKFKNSAFANILFKEEKIKVLINKEDLKVLQKLNEMLNQVQHDRRD